MVEPFPNTVIAVGDRALCVWDQELTRHNQDFFGSFDPKWFQEVMGRHLDEVTDGDEVPQSVALGVRLTYHHALETFFGLLFALFQAPRCMPAWLALYELQGLRGLIRSVNVGAPMLNAWRRPNPSWQDLAGLTTELGWPGDEETTNRFGVLWQRLAHEFLDEARTGEYNSLKHGFRARPSGGGIAIGLEHEYGVAPPPEEMKWLGRSDHGSSAFVVVPIPETVRRRQALHFHLREESVFWLLETTALKIQHLSMSMENVLAAARVHNGASANTVLFHRPQDPDSYELPWRKGTGVTGFKLSFPGPGDGVAAITREQVETMMREASGLGDEGAEEDSRTGGN
ncbi:MAG: hypothetical protein ACYC6F_17540 [Longimicrobiales bacterium]